MKTPISNNMIVILSAKKDSSNLKSQEKMLETSPDYRNVLITNLDKNMTDPAQHSTFLI